MDEARLSRARIRPARSEEDLDRVTAFLRTPRVREIAEGHPEERGSIRMCEVDGELIAALILDPTPLRVRDVEIACMRILETPGEDGRALFRRTGDRDLFVLVLEEALGYVWIKNYPIAYVHGELSLYPAHGFVPCFFHPRVHVPVEAALRLPAPYRVRPLKSGDVNLLAKLRETSDRRSKPVVFSAGVPPFHHFSIESPARELMGYLSLQAQAGSRWRPPLFVPEVEAADRAAAFTVLNHCARKARDAGLEEMHFPLGPGHPVGRLCLELGGRATVKGASADPFADEEMIHLVDPSRLVKELAPYLETRLQRASLTDLEATIPVTTGAGSWAFRVERGRVWLDPVERIEGPAIELPHWAFTQFLAGYRGVDELEAHVPDEYAGILVELLPKTWPFSMPDPDVWDEVAAPEPFSDEARIVVERTRLPWSVVA